MRRDNGVKEDIPRGSLVENVKELLEKIQQNMYEVAKQKREACVQEVKTWDEFIKALNEKKLILAPWCDEEVSYTAKKHIPTYRIKTREDSNYKFLKMKFFVGSGERC